MHHTEIEQYLVKRLRISMVETIGTEGLCFMRKVDVIIIALIMTFLGSHETIYASSFQTEALRQLALSLKLNPDSIQEGYSIKVIDGNSLSLRKEAGVVTHIGYHLFDEPSIVSEQSELITFLERYFLQLMYPSQRTNAQMHRDFRTRFELGGLSDVRRILSNDVFELSAVAGQSATAKWSREGKPFIVFSFPLEYQLLSGLDKLEAEARFEKDLKAVQIESDVAQLPTLVQMTPTKQEGFLILKGNSYIDKRLNSDTYYNIVDGKPRLLLEITHPAESCANLMLSTLAGGDYQLNIRQILYGYNQSQYQVPLAQWISFCHSQKCQLYFGVEKVTTTEVRASVIAVNDMAGYNHVMFLKIPFKAIDEKKGNIDAQVHAYVPMHNVVSLFDKFRNGKQVK